MVITTEELDRIIQNDWHGDMPPHCICCGYNLTGRASDRCPECGEPFNRRRWKERAADIRAKIRQVDQLADLIPVGLVLAGVGAALRLGSLLFGLASVIAMLGKGLGFMFGIGAVYLGCGFLRRSEIPDWAREKLESKPDGWYAATAIFVGVCLMASTFLPW